MLSSGGQGGIVTGRRGIVMITVVAVAVVGMLCIDGAMKRLSEQSVGARGRGGRR